MCVSMGIAFKNSLDMEITIQNEYGGEYNSTGPVPAPRLSLIKSQYSIFVWIILNTKI